MPDYQKAKIYKLWSPSQNLVYYGSTTQTLSQRLADHIKKKRLNIGGQYTSYLVLDCEDYKMELVEAYPCNNREQLAKKEGEYVKNNKCVNIRVEGRTMKEWYEENKTRLNQYDRERSKKRDKQKEKERKDKYRKNNLEKCKLREKKYNETKKQNNAIYKWLITTGIIQ